MPSQWNAAADRDLLLSIIDQGKLQSLNWHAVAAKMAEKDYTFTHEACRQHFQKLRRASTAGGDSTPGTPRTPRTPKTPVSRKGKRFANDNDDDEEEAATPSKKRKRASVAKKVDAGEGEGEGEGGDVKRVVDFGGFHGQTAGQFKMETLSSEEEVVDLEGEGIYA